MSERIILHSVAISLEENELPDAYRDATKAARQWFKPFDEFERLASNLPSPALPEAYPEVTDGTLAALVSETPMRTWAQLQTGRVVALETGDDDYEAWKTEMVNIAWSNKIIPNANTMAPFFSKLQTSQYRSLIYGSQPYYSFQVARDGYVGSDFVLPYIKNVKMEPGKVSDRDCDYIFLDTYYTKLQWRTLIKEAVADKDGLSGWDVALLKEAYDKNIFNTDKDSEDQSSSEKDKQSYSAKAKLVTVFHRGHKSPFYTFIPSMESRIVRVNTNKNTSGDLPINFIYNQQDLINPYGRGQIELAGPTQNMVDFLMAAFGLATQQGLEPTLIAKSDDYDTSGIEWDTLHFAPGNVMMPGKADVSTFKTTTNVYDSFATNSGIFKTQIMNLQGSSDASVSSTSGNPQYSKTPAGVKYQQDRTNAKDNFLRQRADEAVSQLAKNLINLYLANMHGEEFVKITEDQRDKLVKSGKSVPEGVNKILIEFDELKDGEFEYDVDPNSSVVKNDDDTKDRLVELTTTLLGIPDLQTSLQAEGKELRIGELISRILSTSGIDNWEKVIVDSQPVEATDETGDAIPNEMPEDIISDEAPEMDALGQEQFAMRQEQPQEMLSDSQMSEQVQPGARDDEMIELLEAGFDADTVLVILMLRDQGWEEERIKSYLESEAAIEGEQR